MSRRHPHPTLSHQGEGFTSSRMVSYLRDTIPVATGAAGKGCAPSPPLEKFSPIGWSWGENPLVALAKNSVRSAGIDWAFAASWRRRHAGEVGERIRAKKGPSSDDFANRPRSPGCVVSAHLWAGLVDAAKIAVLVGHFTHKWTAKPLVAILIHPKISRGIIGWTHHPCKGENVGATLPTPAFDIFAAGREISHIRSIGAALAAIRTGRAGR